MRDHDTEFATDDVKLEAEAPDDSIAGDCHASTVFADPVAYLARFGLRSELAETHHGGLPAAA